MNPQQAYEFTVSVWCYLLVRRRQENAIMEARALALAAVIEAGGDSIDPHHARAILARHQYIAKLENDIWRAA
jgi:hypothetical protein